MNQTTLLRYNFRVMMLNNWLLLAFPIAVSQLTVFWLILTRQFSVELPAQSVEMVTPILAAFLGAHLMGAEYRSRVGAILASRPVNIGKIVLARLLVMLMMVWGLAIISLLAYRFMGKPFDLLPPFLACIPSTLFLTMLSLTFATLFRNSLSGFAVAALYWALDLVPGPPLLPYLSLRTLSAYYSVLSSPPNQTFLMQWWIAKIILTAGAVILYLYHNRLVFKVGTPLTIKVRRRAGVTGVVGIAIYMLAGIFIKVGYGYEHLGQLPHGDLAWFRYQIGPFGPIPVSSLFGTTFKSYIGDIGNPWRASGEEADLRGATADHKAAMHLALRNDPHSVWAPSIAYGLCELEGHAGKKTDESVAYYRGMLSLYPTGPYAALELRDIAHTYIDADRPKEARAPYEELIKTAPDSPLCSEAYRYLYEAEFADKNLPAALTWAEKWSRIAPVYERFEALLDVAKLKLATGDVAGSKKAAAETLSAVAEFDRAFDDHLLPLGPKQTDEKARLSRQASREAERMK